MPGEPQQFEISFEESLKLKPILKDQKEPVEIEGAPKGKWWLDKMETTFTPGKLEVIVTARKADDA